MKNEPLQDEFHAEMRRRMKDVYYNHGGKERANIRKYLKRYNLGKEVLNDYETDEDKLVFLRQYAKNNRKINTDIPTKPH